mgnify:CR=1 FL=1
MEERLKLLIAEMEDQLREIDRLHDRVELKSRSLRADPENDDIRDSLGYALHNLYCAYEDLFRIVADFFENQIEPSGGYHLGLLRRMRVEIEGVRPRLISDESFELLDELRGFRHVFRHAYTYHLDPVRLLNLADRVKRLRDLFQRDYERFKSELLKGLETD